MHDQPDPIHDLMARAMTRRRMLQMGAGASVAAFLAACGTAGTNTATPNATAGATGTPRATAPLAPTKAPSATAGTTGTPGATETPEDTGTPGPKPSLGGPLRMASWIGYMPQKKGAFPIPDRFSAATGIAMQYLEDVNDNEGFYTSDLEGPLQADQPTGWDIVVLTDWMMQRLITRGWLEKVDTTFMANYPKNLVDSYKTRPWDPDNTYAIPWQSGMTGIGYDRKATGDLTDIGVFWDPAYKGKTTYQTELNDTVGLTAIHLGFDPETLTEDQFNQSVAAIKDAVDNGQVRRLTGNDYVNGMQQGDVLVAMAWSGDVLGLLVPDEPADKDFQWALPTQGGMLWTDNMGIPKGAVNKVNAEAWIDYYYDPAVAAEIEAFVYYVCPVKGAAEAIVAFDDTAATNPLIFPTDEMYARLKQFISSDLDTRQRWEAAFADAIGL